MFIYYIEAIDPEGNKIRKTIEVDSEFELMQLLDYSNLIPLKIKKLPKYYKIISSINPFKHKVKRQEVIEVLENLHLVVKSGLPLNTGIMDLSQDSENPALKDILMDIALKIQSGKTLSQAVEKYESVFTPVVISLFKIGEETGNLDRTLKDAAEHLKKIEDLVAKTKQALIYPAFAFFSVLGAMIFWLVYVLPKIIDAFQDFNVKLPITTIILLKMSEYTQKYIVHFIIFLLLSILILKILRKKNKKVRYYTDKLILKLPVFGIISTNFNYAFFAEYIRLMISAGLPLYQALNIMESAIRNFVFKTAVKNVREKIEVGENFSQSLKEQEIFSSLIIRMISVGEQTGSLEQQLSYIADYYYNKVREGLVPIFNKVKFFFMLILFILFLRSLFP